MECDNTHAEHGRCCGTGTNHEMCQYKVFEAGRFVGVVTVPNPNYVSTTKKTREQVDDVFTQARRGVNEKRKEERRNVGRSSVQHPTEAERMAGAEEAGKALEPEFLDAAIEGGNEIMRHLERMTADDMWEWLDSHGHYTSHPKAMKSILSRLIADKVIEPVPDEDPDSHRTPRRSNKSRLLRVYRSLIYEGPPLIAQGTLRDFG